MLRSIKSKKYKKDIIKFKRKLDKIRNQKSNSINNKLIMKSTSKKINKQINNRTNKRHKNKANQTLIRSLKRLNNCFLLGKRKKKKVQAKIQSSSINSSSKNKKRMWKLLKTISVNS